jgi:hypothetical protein
MGARFLRNGQGRWTADAESRERGNGDREAGEEP